MFLDRLFDAYGVRLVAFDVIFAERDKSSGLPVLQELAHGELKGVPAFETALRAIEPTLEFDHIFAKKMHGRAVVLGYYLTNTQKTGERARRVGVLPPPVLPKGVIGANIAVTKWSGYGANLPELQAAAASAGHINPLPDEEDGVMRRVPMLAEVGDGYYEPLSLAVVRLYLGLPEVLPGYGIAPGGSGTYPGLEWLDVGPHRIPVDNQVAALVPYRGEAKTFKYISAIKGAQGREGVARRAGGQDRARRDLGTRAPGHALDPGRRGLPRGGDPRQPDLGHAGRHHQAEPSYVLGAEILLLALAGLVMALVLPLLNPIRSGVTTVVVLGAVVGTNLWVWQHANMVLPLASGVLMILLLFALNMSYGFFVESRAKRQITGRFGQYVPPELVDEMAQNPDKFSMEGESREMSVLFSDVRGFTTISEGLEPKQLSQLMNEFLTPLTRVIYRQRATIDKYMGDCIMAFWGAPLNDPQHARNAVLAGLEMQAAMDALQPQFRARGWPELHIGVGVNSGRMSVGNMGSDVRVAYTVMGGAVNLASRLEGPHQAVRRGHDRG